MKENKIIICVVGLGYVGLPLLIELAKFFDIYGYDLSIKRIKELKNKNDRYDLIKKKNFSTKNKIFFTNKSNLIKNCNFIIVTVPTPITKNNKPNLTFLKNACTNIGKNLKKNSIVVFESTVYPGATKEICIPILKKYSKLKLGKDFFVSYSPERVNIGDKKNYLKNITKIISGNSKKTVDKVKNVYSKIIKNIYIAENIEVAEFAKVFENTQRDLNLSLINELSVICNKMNINTIDVINAASTKWNFMKLSPGLVGGHCIGVDPYYLSFKSNAIGYKTKVINAGRLVNNAMPNFIFYRIKHLMKNNLKNLMNAKIIFFGLSFKENCNDIRNSKVFDLIKIFQRYNCKIYLHDPYALNIEVKEIYKKTITPINHLPSNADIVVLSVKHKYYEKIGVKNITKYLKKGGIFADLKSVFKRKEKFLQKYKVFNL